MADTAIKLPKGIDKAALVKKLQHEKDTAFKYQKRRHKHWAENYELYRDIIRTNRLTQRQAINIPLMKETVRTIGSKVNEPRTVFLEDRGGVPDREIVANSLWDNFEEQNNLILQDRVDTKQELLYGRSHYVLNVINGQIKAEVKDTYSLLVDPKTQPWDTNTARYTVDIDIYRPLDLLLQDKRLDKEGLNSLRMEYSDKSNAQSDKYKDQNNAKNERLKSIGVTDVKTLEGYDKIVALDGHITTIYDESEKKENLYYCLMAGGKIMLSAKPLVEVIGVDFMPMEGWADDLELVDYWSDGIADLIRIPNKVINAWISQYMENRTLRSLGMHFYDNRVEGLEPQQWTPRAFGWYGLPGNPKEVLQQVDVPELQGTLESIQFLVNIAERATASGAVEKGAVEDVKRTLGEVEIAVGNAMKRTNDMALFYEHSRKRMVDKWYKMLAANTTEDQPVKLYKKNYDGVYVGKEIKKEDWYSEEGVNIVIESKGQRVLDQTDEVVRMQAVQQQFPNNQALKKASLKRQLRIIDLTPEEAEEIQQEEEDNAAAALQGMGTPEEAQTIGALELAQQGAQQAVV